MECISYGSYKFGHEIPQFWHFLPNFFNLLTCRLHSPAACKALNSLTYKWASPIICRNAQSGRKNESTSTLSRQNYWYRQTKQSIIKSINIDNGTYKVNTPRGNAHKQTLFSPFTIYLSCISNVLIHHFSLRCKPLGGESTNSYIPVLSVCFFFLYYFCPNIVLAYLTYTRHVIGLIS